MGRQRLLAGRVGRDTGLDLFPVTVFAGPRSGLQPGSPGRRSATAFDVGEPAEDDILEQDDNRKKDSRVHLYMHGFLCYMVEWLII
jgi:hypothetical protein